MSVRGIDQGYFAGMPTTQLDPRAGQPGEGYMAMPGQALTEANNLNLRRKEDSDNNAFKAREQRLGHERDRGAATRDQQRIDINRQDADRRQQQQGLENDRLKSADTMKLTHALQAALDDGETAIASVIAAELHSRGVGVKLIGAQGAPAPAQPNQQVATGADSGPPEIKSQDMSWLESGAPAGPMSAKDAATAKALEQQGDDQSAKILGPGEASTSDVRRNLLPGGTSSPMRRPATAPGPQDPNWVSPDDPYSKYTK